MDRSRGVSSLEESRRFVRSSDMRQSSHPGHEEDLGSQRQRRSRQEKENERQLKEAAHASRLPANGLCAEEFKIFQHHLSRSSLKSYLKVRNTMLWLWRESPKEPLTLARAFEATKNFGLHHGLVFHVFEFLLRSGYINFGICGPLDSTHTLPDRPCSGNRKTIAIIGGGIAGIAVARQLENLFQYYSRRFEPELPPKVIILEARSRIGGRMHTLELGTNSASALSPTSHPVVSDGQTRHAVDLGAQIITGFNDGNPMEIIVRRQLSDLTLHYLADEGCILFDHSGQPVSTTMDTRCEAIFNRILDQACQLREQDELPQPLKDYLTIRAKQDNGNPGRVESVTAATLGHTMDFFLESHPNFPKWTHDELGLLHWHYANLEFANATPLDQLSLRHWDQDDDYEFSGRHSMVVRGYGQIPVALSQGLDIHLNTPVSSIERSNASTKSKHCTHSVAQDKEPIHINCRDGTTFNCSIAVVTVPLGVLKSRQINFSPPLPPWKEQAIQHLGFGLLNKLVLVFDKPFWDTTTELFGYVGSGKEGSSAGYDLNSYRSSRGKFYMFWNCMVVAGLPVLVTLLAGQSAYDCEKMSKEDLVQEALETLALIYPEKVPIPRPLESIVTRWSHDEFAQGSYSFVGREGTGDDYDLLAKSVDDQLYFAGEATSRQYPATAHGAYLSGTKVAKEIVDTLIGPQVIRSDRRESLMANEEVENGHTDVKGPQLAGGSDGSNYVGNSDRSTGGQSADSSLSQPFASPLYLGHEYVVPRRRGRVSQSLVAQFVAELSDTSEGEESTESSDSGSDNEVKVGPQVNANSHDNQVCNGYHIEYQSSVGESTTKRKRVDTD